MVDQCGHSVDADGATLDENGMRVEDFGLPRNLMLACAATIVIGDACACLAQMAAHYGPPSALESG